MSTIERTIRIILTLVAICYGLILLNHSFYSFWVAGGPPNNYPNTWYQHGIISGWRALLLILVGVFIQFRWEKLKTSKITWLSITLVLIGLSYPYLREFFLIDSCLDNGGSWSTKYFECKQ